MKIERISDGKIELHLSKDPDQFKRFAEWVRMILGGRWIVQIDGLDQSYWDLEANGMKITVHREHFIGVSVFGDDDPVLRALLEKVRQEFETLPRK